MRLRLVVLAAGIGLALVSGVPSAQSPALKGVMQSKLDSTRALLEPVIRADFAAIVRHVEPLSWISEKEIASWQDAVQPQYTQQAVLFLLSVNGLRDAAAAKDMEGVMLEYTTLISSCVRCHTYVNTTRRASLSPVELRQLFDQTGAEKSAARGDNSAAEPSDAASRRLDGR